MITLFLHSSIIIFAFMVLMFIIAQIKKDNSIVDIGWGIGFILVAAALMIKEQAQTLPLILLTLMVAVWGLRLAVHIGYRSRGKAEDFRYAQWRKDWGDKAVINAFIRVFMLQGILMLLISTPIITAFTASNALSFLSFFGIGIFITGFLIEAVGDCQLTRFKQKAENRGQIITSGIWNYTRHPNYLGEAMLWWGIGLYAFSISGEWIAFFGPLLLNFLLLKVSGIPMLEKKYEGRADWEAYKQRTPAFFPFLGKKG